VLPLSRRSLPSPRRNHAMSSRPEDQPQTDPNAPVESEEPEEEEEEEEATEEETTPAPDGSATTPPPEGTTAP
jgi:hypothetical protein